MPSRKELELRANAIGLDPSTYSNDSKLESQLLYKEKTATAFTGTLATGTLTSTGVAPADGDTVTIGTYVYTFKTALTPTAGQVLIGASAAAALDNLKAAINGDAGGGTTYAANTPVHPQVTATTNTDTTQVVQAKSYAVTNASVPTTETSTVLSWGAATLAGGVARVLASSAATVAGVSGGVNHA